MERRRRVASRVLNPENIHKFFLPAMLELDLKRMWLTEDCFRGFDCPNLVHLDLKGCARVTDAVVQQLARASPHLRLLRLLDNQATPQVSSFCITALFLTLFGLCLVVCRLELSVP